MKRYLDTLGDVAAFATLIIVSAIIYCIVCPPEPTRHADRALHKIAARAL